MQISQYFQHERESKRRKELPVVQQVRHWEKSTPLGRFFEIKHLLGFRIKSAYLRFEIPPPIHLVACSEHSRLYGKVVQCVLENIFVLILRRKKIWNPPSSFTMLDEIIRVLFFWNKLKEHVLPTNNTDCKSSIFISFCVPSS